VHGLQGHPERTWTYSPHVKKKTLFRRQSSGNLLREPQEETVFWPYDLLSKHESLARARLLTWGYNTLVVTEFFGTSDQQNISQHGNNLMVALQQERKKDVSSNIVYVIFTR